MSSREWQVRVQDIVDAIASIQRLTAGITFAEFVDEEAIAQRNITLLLKNKTIALDVMAIVLSKMPVFMRNQTIALCSKVTNLCAIAIILCSLGMFLSNRRITL